MTESPNCAPLVTVVMPTYNGEKYIREAIASCLAQTYRNLELIVVDDGSTDSTPEILAAYDDPRLVVLRHTTNRKLPEALNTGFTHAHGEYFFWMADDDLLAPQAIDLLAGFLLQNPDVDAVYSDYEVMDEAGNTLDVMSLQSLNLRQDNICTPAFMYKRLVYQHLRGYDPAWFLVEDYHFWLRAWLHFRLVYLPTPSPIYRKRQHGQNLTARYSYLRAHRLAIRVRKELLGLSRREVQRQLAQVEIHEAFDRYRRGDRWGTVSKVFLALLRDPSWARNRGVLAVTARSLLPFLR